MNARAKRALEILQEFSIPLVTGVIITAVWANLDQSGHEDFIHWSPFGPKSHINFQFLINDIFMVFFFGIAAAEIVEACMPGGDLNPPTKAINPLLATAGGVLGPVGVFFLYVFLTGNSEIAGGWGIPTATDIALAWLLARVIFGKGHPAISFLLLLAIVDDGIGLAIIAIFYPNPEHPARPAFLGLVVGAMILGDLLRRAGVKSFWPYLLGPGVMSWFGLFLGELHPALALVPVVPFMPHEKRDHGLFGGTSGDDTLNRFEHFFKIPVDIGLFGFGVANAGVAISSVGPATWAVLSGLAIGKTAGIFLFSRVAELLGFPLPHGMNVRSLFMAGLTASLGLTVALFVAGVAYTDPVLQGAAKMGALGSALVVPLALVLGRILKVKKDE